MALGSLTVLAAAGGAGMGARILLGQRTPKRPPVDTGGTPASVPTAWVRLAPNETPAPAASPIIPTKGTGEPLQFWHPFGADAGGEPAAHAAIWAAYSTATHIPIIGTAIPAEPSKNLLTTLIDAIAADRPPDAICLDRLSLLSALVANVTIDLSAFNEKDGVSASAYYRHVWDDVHLANKLTATPFGADARGLWWRRDYMAEQKLNPDRGPSTLEELARLTVGPSITPQGRQQWGFSPYVGDTHPYTWGIPDHARWFDATTRRMTATAVPNVKALTWYAAQAKSGLPPTAPGGPSPLLTGAVQTLVDGHWLLGGLTTEQQALYGAAPLPPAANNPATNTWSSGYGVAVPRGATRLEASWALAAFYAGPVASLAYIGAGGRRVMPAQPELATHPAVLAPGKLWQTFLAMLPAAWARPDMPEAAFAWAALADAGEHIRQGAMPPEQALQAVDNAVNAALERDGW